MYPRQRHSEEHLASDKRCTQTSCSSIKGHLAASYRSRSFASVDAPPPLLRLLGSGLPDEFNGDSRSSLVFRASPAWALLEPALRNRLGPARSRFVRWSRSVHSWGSFFFPSYNLKKEESRGWDVGRSSSSVFPDPAFGVPDPPPSGRFQVFLITFLFERHSRTWRFMQTGLSMVLLSTLLVTFDCLVQQMLDVQRKSSLLEVVL